MPHAAQYVCIFEDFEKSGNVCDRIATVLVMPNLIPCCDVHLPPDGTFIEVDQHADSDLIPVNEGEPTVPPPGEEAV